MIQLKLRSEYSFRTAYGHISDVVSCSSGNAVGLCDRASTFGYVQFQKECRKQNKKPIFGVELGVVDDEKWRPAKGESRKQGVNYMSFLAKNTDGIVEIYDLVSAAYDNFFYIPRIDYDRINGISSNLVVLIGANPRFGSIDIRDNVFQDVFPGLPDSTLRTAQSKNIALVATSNNFYPNPDDEAVYETMMIMNADSKTVPMYVVHEDEWSLYNYEQEALDNVQVIADMCNAELPTGNMVKTNVDKSLRQLCIESGRLPDLPNYMERLDRELSIIKEKNFEDYFYVIWDLVQYAKSKMLVGPARGSSCGSLVCYCLGITDIDPLKYDLLFERFIDINRFDMPDIDIDFQDNKRHLVGKYLRKKYGNENVVSLGLVSKYRPAITINETAKACRVPSWEIERWKDSITAKLVDEFETYEGKEILKKYPELEIAKKLEGHSRHSGKHAAGILVTDSPVNNFCSIGRDGIAQIDKNDAEDLNLLKIDALGLSTLTVMDDCLSQISYGSKDIGVLDETLSKVGLTHKDLPLDDFNDPEVFALFNSGRLNGIFQFEGQTMKRLTRSIEVKSLDDIISLTTIGRPGPLESGGADTWIARRNGTDTPRYVHEIHEKYTSATYGVIIFQEQVMQIARELGNMSWPDVTKLRKVIAKSKGDEITKFQDRFVAGAIENGLSPNIAQLLWDQIKTMGGYAFNKSHAVAYAIVSYWTAWAKAKYPVEFAIANLRYPKSDESMVQHLRDIEFNNFPWVAFDHDKSMANEWRITDGVLYGPYSGIKGIGIKKASVIHDKVKAIQAGSEEVDLSPSEEKFLMNPITPYDDIWPCRNKWKKVFEDPAKYNIISPLSHLEDVYLPGEYVVICQLTKLEIRDANSPKAIKKRGNAVNGPTKYVIGECVDDTGIKKFYIPREDFVRYRGMLKVGKWCIFKGEIQEGFDLYTVRLLRILHESQIVEE